MTELKEKSNLANIKYVGNRLKILGCILLLIGLYILAFYLMTINFLIILAWSITLVCLSYILIHRIGYFWKKDWDLKHDHKYYYICYIQEVARKENEKIEREKWAKHVKRIP